MIYTNDSQFYSSEISDNISMSPEGYLICHSVPIARTGEQIYLGEEIGQPEFEGKRVKVYRLAEEVLNPTVIASFEGKAFTDDHPSQLPVKPDNHSRFARGHVQNVRTEKDVLIADLVVQDPTVIDKIKNKIKRQVSAGYNCQYEPYKDGFKQVTIRGNHVALVDVGRAGPTICIKDSAIKQKGVMEMTLSQIQSQLLLSYVNDSKPTPEEFAKVLGSVMTGDAAIPAKVEPKEDNESGLTKLLLKVLGKTTKDAFPDDLKDKENCEDEDPIEARFKSMEDSIAKMADSIKGLMNTDEHADEEEDIELINKLLASDEEPEDKDVTDEEPKDEDKKESKETIDAAIRIVVGALKPSMAKLPPKSQKMMKDSMAEVLKRSKSGKYGEISKAVQTHAKVTQDSAPVDHTQLGKDWAAKFNPHYKKA